MKAKVNGTANLLHRVLSQPTAPFREGWVANEIRRILDENGIPYFSDENENIIAGVSSSQELSKGFRIGLMAHMDHPGFHLGEKVRGRKSTYHCTWHGGAPFKDMLHHSVRLYDPNSRMRTITGQIIKIGDPFSTPQDATPFQVEFEPSIREFSKTSFGAFDFPGCEIIGDEVVTRAADDLAGCVIALGALLDQEETFAKKSLKDTAKSNSRSGKLKLTGQSQFRQLIGIFTRAEEVGFVGCLDLLKQNLLPEAMWIVSLEASRELPEAVMGRGPVLRLGDKASLFNSDFSSLLWKIAQDLERDTEKDTKKSKQPFQYQRRLMGGGTCEATALQLYGHIVTGIAVPLVNYHNQGESAPASKPEPEKISLRDVEMARRLCFELGQRTKEKPNWNRDMQKRILARFKNLRPLLRERIEYHEE